VAAQRRRQPGLIDDLECRSTSSPSSCDVAAPITDALPPTNHFNHVNPDAALAAASLHR
jgi:hypothetical protein